MTGDKPDDLGLSGVVVCGPCGMPMLSDGQGHYVHWVELRHSRLRVLLRDEHVLKQLHRWLIGLEGKCPGCGEAKRIFAGVSPEQFRARVRSGAGARDFRSTLREFLGYSHH